MKFERTQVAQFQSQNCTQTLREALAEFYAINAHLFSKPEAGTRWTDLLVRHDVAHVIFGVNVNVLDETAGDYWTLLASDLSVKEYRGYMSSPEGKKLIKQVGFVNLVKSLIFGLPLLCKIFVRSRKMRSKWKSKSYEQYMDIPLCHIRDIFNLKILEYRD